MSKMSSDTLLLFFSVDINECDETSVCFNGGVCNNTVGSYMCICTTGYTGLQCESGRTVLINPF